MTGHPTAGDTGLAERLATTQCRLGGRAGCAGCRLFQAAGGHPAAALLLDRLLRQPRAGQRHRRPGAGRRSEEHTSELQSLMRISYAVFCLKKKTKTQNSHNVTDTSAPEH